MGLTTKDKDEVCDVWVRLLTLALGWPKERAKLWAEGQRSLMDNEDWFLHETTSWYVLNAVITDEIRTSAKRPGDMASQLDLALERFRIKSERNVSAEDVEAIRSEIRAIIIDCT